MLVFGHNISFLRLFFQLVVRACLTLRSVRRLLRLARIIHARTREAQVAPTRRGSGAARSAALHALQT
jgi:hypothetical protein